MKLALAIVPLAVLSFTVLMDREPRHPVGPARELPPGQTNPQLRLLGEIPLKTGTRLWYRTNEASFGSVFQFEKNHEFEDGSIQPGALVHNTDGSQQWLPMKSLRKVWTEER